MRAIQISKHGEPDVLKLVDIDEPEIKSDNEVKVKLISAGINPIDTKLRAGLYPLEQFPFILGCDGAGVIEACGAKVNKFKPGDEVYFFHGGVGTIPGNYAEYKVLHERFIAHKPSSIELNHAAAAPLVLLTAWESLFEHARIEKGQTVYINAGAGGVGHVAIQLAKNAGATVFTTISNAEKAEYVRSLGADHVINYKEQDINALVTDWTDGVGVDVVIDNVGGEEIQKSFGLIKPYGKMITLLKPDNSVDWSEARIKNIHFCFEVMLTPLLLGLTEKQKHQTKILEDSADLIDAGKLSINLSRQFSLEQAAEAHQMIEEGHTSGKIVLNI